MDVGFGDWRVLYGQRLGQRRVQGSGSGTYGAGKVGGLGLRVYMTLS